MFDFAGRNAFITGGASGIGLGIAKAFARAGARVAIADISEDHLQSAVDDMRQEGLNFRPFRLDVTDRRQYDDVAAAAEAALGPISIVVLNAGVGILAPILDAGHADWNWILGVNLDGTMNGVRTFTPRLRKQRLGGHVLATASLGGLAASSIGGIYSASKFGIIAAMQCLRKELAPDAIGVSVLCPGVVNTNVHKPYDTRPTGDESARYAISAEQERDLKAMMEQGMSPEEVGDLAVQGIRENQPYILTHDARALIEQRRDALLASLD